MKYVPVAPRRVSPLMTHPQRWSGRVKEVPAAVKEAARKIGDVSSNPFAKMLASPGRIDRGNKLIKVPRDVLLRFSLVEGPSAAPNFKKGQLWLVPNIDGFKSLSSDSYVTNSIETLEKTKWHSFVSYDVFRSDLNQTAVRDIQYNKTNSIVVHSIYLKLLLRELENTRKEDLDNGYVEFISDPASSLFTLGRNYIKINISKIPCFRKWTDDDMLTLNLRLLEKNVISFKEDKFIKYLFNFIAYNDNT